MSRKLTAAAFALVMGVMLTAGGTADASNMGFKLERSFEVVDGFRNLYFVSFPLFNGLGDIADDADGSNPCEPGDGDGDGVVNATDALCDFFTDRDLSNGGASMVFSKLDQNDCQFKGRTLLVLGPGSIFVSGTFTEELTTTDNREIGYVINVGAGAGDPTLTNRAVIVGSHDPSFGGHELTSADGCIKDYINLPYHTMYRTANEVLCGLADVDWVDANSDGNPDSCDNGIFDPNTGSSTVVSTFVNEAGAPSQNQYVGRSVLDLGGGNLFFAGTDFDLTPGDAYLVNYEVNRDPTTFLSPHF